MAEECATSKGDKNSTGDHMGRLQFLHRLGARHRRLMTLDKRARQERKRPERLQEPGGLQACRT